MSLSAAHKTHSLFTHLSLSYLAIYAVCAVLLYAINARVISASSRAFDRQDVRSDSLEYVEILGHDNSGNWLAEEVSIENLPPSTIFAIRILNAQGLVCYAASQPSQFNFPGGWGKTDTASRPVAVPKEGWQDIYLPDCKRHLQVLTTHLFDGRILQVAQSSGREHAQQVILFRTSLIFFLLASLFSLGNGYWMMAIALKPIRQVTSNMSRFIETGAFDSEPEPVNSRIAEINTLGRIFTRMTQKNASLIQAMKDTLDNVAHDFRTPLARIRSAAEFALNSRESPPSREALLGILADIIDDCDNARLQLQNLMDIRAMESGVVKLDRQRFDMKTTVSEIADLYAVLAEDKNIALRVDLPDAAVPIDGDPARLAQVLANLIDNAVKYTPSDGHIHIALDSDPGQVRLTVADTGIGIPEEEHALIWQRLYRSRNARPEKGLGLGMSIVKAIVDAHGGKVTFTSSPGKGSTFVLTLPAIG
jgi:signal transduction histidine kinase